MEGGFRCLALAPASLGSSGVPIAAARAGAIGILDLETATDAHQTRRLAAELLAQADGDIGLRCVGADEDLVDDLLRRMSARRQWLIVSAQGRDTLAARLARLPAAEARHVLAEITDVEQIKLLGDAPLAGVVAKGHEAGGWVGEDTSLILLQKVLARTKLPVYVHGGIGIHSAAACRIAGAAGVVLDDQLLLMPESALSESSKRQLQAIGGEDTRILGERSLQRCRVLVRPGFQAADRLLKLSVRAEAESMQAEAWRSAAAELIGWGGPDQFAWPIGQSIAVAAAYRDRYRTTGRLIAALMSESRKAVEMACAQPPLGEGAPLARSHGTRYPIVQGPMTRVSDSAAFAEAVAAAGALPFLALALMNGEQTRALLDETAIRLGKKPWGVGLLGFAPQELRQRQIEAIWAVKPAYALIAGGRPDQAAEFERRGIAAYIHVPTAQLLRMFYSEGARRFVFEGRECGGHIGPLTSFVLWELQIDALLRETQRDNASDVHVLFAGGVHDARSAAMVGAMAAPLVERGMHVGVLMGSAYLFTDEIVATGAITPEFRAQARACTRTVNLETGPGHSTRCADTPFATDFYAERQRLLAAGESADAIRDELENLNLGRLRLASKGKKRIPEKGIVDVDVEEQISDGMYMIGQVATLRSEPTTLEALHRDVSEGSSAIFRDHAVARPARAAGARPSDIAIIGIGTLLPGATSPDAFWANLINKVSSITEIPRERWDWRLYFNEDRHARDKIYSKWGGFLKEIPFDPVRFGIPPRSLKSIDPMQLLTLEVVRRALEDAGYDNGGFDRENTSVIFGAGGGLGDIGMQYGVRSELTRFIDAESDVWDRLPEWTEESFAGTLLNVAAGRVANRFDFGGLNFTVDAACASSLAALAVAVSELESGRSNVAIAGGIDTVQSPFGYLCFSKTQALSAQGTPRTFDKGSDGIAISEGLAVVVLKRLADAERAGDRIYAVIKAVAGSSDGKALGLTAPLPEGQMRALRRAYDKAGFSPATLGLIEAHGTGTSVGDRAEAETIVRTLQASGARPQSCVLGSVKTLIGHTKAAAGVSGLVKVALALHHQTLPPHVGVREPLDTISGEENPVCLLKDARPWFTDAARPRRGAVSSFGFGGTNFHAVVEEYGREFRAGATTLGASNWPCELFLFKGADAADLAREMGAIASALDEGAEPRASDLAYSCALRTRARRDLPAAAAVVAGDLAELRAGLTLAIAAARGDSTKLPPHVQVSLRAPDQNARVAFVFPGQGSQYVNMGREAALYLEPLRKALEQADVVLAGRLPRKLTEYIYPRAGFSEGEETRQRDELTDTKVAQPAIGAISAGLLDFVNGLGISPDMVAGHSYGEFTALHAAGALTRLEFNVLSATRGLAMANAALSPRKGAMAAVQATRADVDAALAGIADVVIANHNSPQQVVISGDAVAVAGALERISAKGFMSRPLPVACAFHSPLMKDAKAPLDAAIDSCAFSPPTVPVYSNVSGRPYPENPTDIRAALRNHMLGTVEFVALIEAMHADGARIFVEVGPKSVLSGLVSQILSGKDHVATSLDAGGGMRGLLAALATLFTQGVHFDAVALHRGRNVRALELPRDLAQTRPAKPTATTWLLSGGCARAPNENDHRYNRLPPLDLDAVETRRTQRAKPPAEAAPAVQAARTPVKNGEARLNGNAHSLPPAPTPPPAHGTVPRPVKRDVVPARLAAPPAGGALADGSLQAFAAYQETMRQFLSLQEQVMTRFISGVPTNAAHTSHVPVAARLRPTAPVSAPIQDWRAERETPSELVTVVNPPIRRGVETIASAAPPVPTAPASAGPTPEQLRTLLLEIVSDRTGYPSDMLGTDRDIEAELGIDSIKRVEILSALQQRVPAPAAARIKARMEQLTRLKTLDRIIALVLEGEAAAPPAKAEPASPAEAGPTPEQLHTLLLEIVSDRTGYPSDMLGTDRDIEAELGIDSIKRVEILSALQQRVPPPAAARIKARMERLTRLKTLDRIIALVLEDDAAAVQAAPSTQAPAKGGPTPEQLHTLLLEIVSDRTGYPSDMLGTDRDIEAELGIDSIKRVEILSALQQRVPAPAAARIKARMEQLTRLKTLDRIIALVLEGEAAAPPAKAEPVSPAEAGPTPEQLRALLLEIVSDRTGYPSDMLGTDRDIEAELGIDSIKRVEILSALQQRVPPPAAARIKARMERLTRLKTLDRIIALVLEEENAAAPAPSPEPISRAAVPSIGVPVKGVPRFAPVGEPSPAAPAQLKLKGLFLLTDDGRGIATNVAQAIRSAGGTCAIIERSALEGHSAIEQAVAEAQRAHGPVVGVLHLAPLCSEPAPERLEDWRRACSVDVKAFYGLLHAAAEDLRAAGAHGNGYIIAASALGGDFGRGEYGGRTCASQRGALGLLKTAALEFPGVRARGVDFDPRSSEDDITGRLICELGIDSADSEVGYPSGQRTAFRTRPTPWRESSAASVQPGAGWIVLVSGGARGITAAVAQSIVRPGMRLIIVGRSSWPTAEASDTRAVIERAALRRALIARAGGASAKVIPVEIDREANRILADREIKDNVARLRAAGAEIEYRSADLRDEVQVRALLDHIYGRYGRLDAVIHGAGIISDKLIADKTPTSFDEVFDTKADSTFLLARLLRPEGLKLVVLFASVAGRFGNSGQGDYAAANEVVNRLAWQMNANLRDARVVSINWGPWDAPGMASDSVKEKFRASGILPIDVQAGCDFLARELALGRKPEVEIVAGDGPWRNADMTPRATETRRYIAVHAPFSSAPRLSHDGSTVVEEMFDLASHPYLGDHRLDGTPVLPAAAALEWLAQLTQKAWPDLTVHDVRDLRVLKGFRLESGSRRGLLRARASSHADAESLKVSIELSDPGSGMPYYRGFATLMRRLPEAPSPTLVPIATGTSFDRETAYRDHLFHGARFQLITSIERLGEEGIEATVTPSLPRQWLESTAGSGNGHAGSDGANWLFDPGLLDTAPQLAIVWARVMRGITPLPSRFTVVSRFGSAPTTGALKVRLRVRPSAADQIVAYDAEFFDSDDRVRLRMEAIESVGYAALNRLGAAE
jgi:acyl transferase domain-containing protein/NAD(P)H-dependent flavin oxidoreductase YrpB (nitropropane dioxygenase family)/NAD(P)-dependent dehydrogenase (short-subunit alcohol dehydrogenase family)